jgi:hypothetical protein
MQNVNYLSCKQRKLKFKIPKIDRKSVSGTNAMSCIEFAEMFIALSNEDWYAD